MNLFYSPEDDHLATEAESCREFARNVGADNPDQAWISTPFDTWEPNPFYRGPDVPHPESDSAYTPDPSLYDPTIDAFTD